MDRGAHTADALRPDPGLAGIAAAQDQLDPAEHGSRTPGIGHGATIDFRFDAQMAFNTGHRVNHDACHRLLLSFPRLTHRPPVELAPEPGAGPALAQWALARPSLH